MDFWTSVLLTEFWDKNAVFSGALDEHPFSAYSEMRVNNMAFKTLHSAE
jgi:hypothetical protein